MQSNPGAFRVEAGDVTSTNAIAHISRLPERVEGSRDLNLTKSECIYAIKAFFRANQPPKDFERIKEIER